MINSNDDDDSYEKQAYLRKRNKLPKITKVSKSVSMSKIPVKSTTEKRTEESKTKKKKSQLKPLPVSISIPPVLHEKSNTREDNNNDYLAQSELKALEQKIKNLEQYTNRFKAISGKFIDFFDEDIDNEEAIKQNIRLDYNVLYNKLPEIADVKIKRTVPYSIAKLLNDTTKKNYEIYDVNEEIRELNKEMTNRFKKFDKNMKLLAKSQKFLLRHPKSVQNYYDYYEYYNYKDNYE